VIDSRGTLSGGVVGFNMGGAACGWLFGARAPATLRQVQKK